MSMIKTATAAILLIGVCGCGDDNTPPTTPPPTPTAEAKPASPLASMAAPVSADAATIAWEVPAGWERVPGEKPMRFATFRRTGQTNEEIAVSQFPGDVGGVLANVNRWRAQVGLGPISDADLPEETKTFDNGKLKGYTMRLKGEPQHMLAAIIPEPEANRTWFVKVTTTPAAADALEADVFAFAQSFGTGKLPAR